MRGLVLATALLLAAAAAAHAEDAVPDLKGTWMGKGKSVIFGQNRYHPGAQSYGDQPRVRDIEVTHVVEGQDGRLAWGHSASSTADTREPFVWAITGDNKSIIGADTDGHFRITLLATDRIEKCYVHDGASPSRSIVATCYTMERTKK
jgi:hypothetical protein